MSLYFKILEEFRKKVSVDDHAYYPQFRLEPRARDADNDNSLAMRVADPLWMLGRQWQFGEFKGESNGSPIGYTVNYRTQSFPFFVPNNEGEATDITGRPLEVVVEAMKVTPDPHSSQGAGIDNPGDGNPGNLTNKYHKVDLRTQVKTGQQLVRIMRRRGVSDLQARLKTLIEVYPLNPYHIPDKTDSRSMRFYKLMKTKSFNGVSALIDRKADAFVDKHEDFRGLEESIDELRSWFKDLYFEPTDNTSAWDSKSLSYRFAIKSDKNGRANAELLASDYQSGKLDWYSFDQALIRSQIRSNPLIQKHQDYPLNLRFAGMPTKRLFALEDNRVDLGSMDIQEDDLIRLMMLDFSLVSGSDWYTIPLTMNSGEACWIDSITVRDVFDVETEIKNGPDVGPQIGKDTDEDGKLTSLDVWDVFKIRNELLTEYDPDLDFLYLPAVVSGKQESLPLEEILFVRDEFSNMVWGIEKRVKNQMGYPNDAYDLHLEYNESFSLASNDKPDHENLPKYRLISGVPHNWIPFIAKPNSPGWIRRAHMVTYDPDQPLMDILPLSDLAKTELLDIQQDAIPRAGLRLQVTRQRIRWTDGKTYVWQGRKALVGRGEGHSGLQFDFLEE